MKQLALAAVCLVAIMVARSTVDGWLNWIFFCYAVLNAESLKIRLGGAELSHHRPGSGGA